MIARLAAFFVLFVLCALGLTFTAAAHAQSWPAKSVRVIVPWPPGQATDIAARLVGQKLQEALGQPFVMDNKPGAGGTIGTEIAVRSPADGYTLLAFSSGPISIAPAVQKTSYDPLRDLAPVAITTTTSYALVTAASFPARDGRELVALLRANPDKYTFSSSGAGATTHLIVEAFNAAAGVKVRHIPYKGSVPALTDVMNGQVSFTIETLASTVPHIRSGKLKAYGVSLARRSQALPEVAPLAEAAGLPGFDIGGWIGYAAPAGTPREVVARLSAEIARAMQTPEMRERFTNIGLDPVTMTPEETVAFIRQDIERYGQIVRSANVKID
jgi:tripartite-type tricarboxylate transporter receptor subunit TctC